MTLRLGIVEDHDRLVDDLATEILELLVGPVESTGWKVLEGCNCPNCSTISVIDIK